MCLHRLLRALPRMVVLAAGMVVCRLQAQPALTWQANPDFGKVLVDATPGTVALSPLAGRLPTGGATLFNGTVAALSFQVSGPTGNAFTLSGFPGSLTLTGGGSTVTVDTWVTNLSAGGVTGLFGASPTTILAGATLRLPGSPVAGVYSNTFSLTVHDDTANQSSTPAVTVTVTAWIGNALATLKVSDLVFGTLAAASAGTCTISPTGARSVTGGVMAVGSTLSAGALTITGTPSAAYTVTLPLSCTLTGPAAATLTVDTFTSATTPALQLNGSGSGSLLVGAKLAIPNNATHGAYTGSFIVTVAYN